MIAELFQFNGVIDFFYHPIYEYHSTYDQQETVYPKNLNRRHYDILKTQSRYETELLSINRKNLANNVAQYEYFQYIHIVCIKSGTF